jgi:hypothetical protein
MNTLNNINSILENNTHPVVSMKYLNTIEKEFNIIFPNEFKIFYSQISNGASANKRRLYSIEKIVSKLDKKKLNMNFNFKQSIIWGDELSMQPHSEIEYGNIEVADMGDGITWHLIVNGDEYGKMWLFTEMGILNCCTNVNFLEWFELWIQKKDSF